MAAAMLRTKTARACGTNWRSNIASVLLLVVLIATQTLQADSSVGSWDCSSEPVCATYVHPQLMLLRNLLMLSGLHGVEMCQAALEDSSAAANLLPTACSRIATASIINVTASWLPRSDLCRSSADQYNRAAQSLGDPRVLGNVSRATETLCQTSLLLNSMSNASVAEKLQQSIPSLTTHVLTTILLSSQSCTTINNCQSMISATDSSSLQSALLHSLNLTLLPLTDPSLLAINDILVSLKAISVNVTNVLSSYSLPNSGVFLNQTVFQLCSSLYPTCQCSSVQSLGAMSASQTLDVWVIRPCYWMCVTTDGLLSVVQAFVTDAADVYSSPLFTVLSAITQCANSTASQCVGIACKDPSTGSFVCSMNSTQFSGARLASQQICVIRENRCLYPLRETSNPQRYSPHVKTAVVSLNSLISNLFPGLNTTVNSSILPCAEACTGVLFSTSRESLMRSLVVALTFFALTIQIFALLSFFINRNKLNRFPTRILACFNACFCVVCVGILAQVSAGWQQVACHEDGTLRLNLPDSESGSGWCVFNAFVIYYGLIAALFWWFCLSHAWYMTFKALTDAKKQYLLKDHMSWLDKGYHVFVWVVSAAVTAAFVGVRKVGGVPMLGICFTVDKNVWFYFLTFPSLVVGAAGTPFLASGLYQLSKTQRRVQRMHSHRRGGTGRRDVVHLRRFQTKLGIVMMMSFVNLIAQFAVGLYQTIKWTQWVSEVEKHVACNLLACDEQRHLCPPLPEPSFSAFLIAVLAILLEGIAMSSWAATKDNMHAWKQFWQSPRFIIRYGIPSEENLKKSRLSDVASEFRKSFDSRRASTSKMLSSLRLRNGSSTQRESLSSPPGNTSHSRSPSVPAVVISPDSSIRDFTMRDRSLVCESPGSYTPGSGRESLGLVDDTVFLGGTSLQVMSHSPTRATTPVRLKFHEDELDSIMEMQSLPIRNEIAPSVTIRFTRV